MFYTLGLCYFSYEILTGLLVIRREHFYKRDTYIPPSLMFARDRAHYVDWRDSK